VSKEIIWSTLDGMRLSGLLNRELVIQVIQVFAWAKLSEKKEIEESKSIFNTKFSNIGDKELASLFRLFSASESLGDNRKAFEIQNIDRSVPIMMSLHEVVNVIKEAAERGLIDYLEVIDNCLEWLFRDQIYSATPFEVSELMSRLINPSDTESVYCPFSSSLKLAAELAKKTGMVHTESEVSSPLPYLINILHDVTLQNINSDPILSPGWLENNKLKEFDISAATPPFNKRYSKKIRDWHGRFEKHSHYSDIYHMRHLLAQTKKRSIIIVSHGALFREAAEEKSFREEMVSNGLIDAILYLPSGLLANTGIPFSIVIFRKDKQTKDIFLMDLTSDDYIIKNNRGKNTLKGIDDIEKLYREKEGTNFSRLVKFDEIVDNDFNLSSGHYLSSSKGFVVRELIKNINLNLGGISKIIRPQAVSSKIEDQGKEFFEVTLSDLPNAGYIKKPSKKVMVASDKYKRAKGQTLKPLDILISTKGSSVGKIGIVPKDLTSDWLANQSFQIIRLIDKDFILPEALFMYLRSSFAREIFKALETGAAISQLSSKSVKDFPVINPGIEEQHNVKRAFDRQVKLQNEVHELESEIESLNTSDYWEIDTIISNTI
jgi:type I restriction enzyme M protein